MATTPGLQPGQRGFKVIPRRWVVERTFACLNQYRRLSQDYAYLMTTDDAMIYAALIRSCYPVFLDTVPFQTVS